MSSTAGRRQNGMSNEPTTGITEVRTVAIPVNDQDQAFAFYTATLGLELRVDATYGQGQRWVEVAPAGAATSIALTPAREEVRAGVDTDIRLTTRDADADHAHLLARGVDVDPEVLRWPGAPAMFTFRDVDGNRLVILEES